MNTNKKQDANVPMFGPYKMTALRVVYPADPTEYTNSHVLKVGMTLVDTGDSSAWKDLVAEIKRAGSVGSPTLAPVSEVCPECKNCIEPSEDPWRVEFVHNHSGVMVGFHIVCSKECMEKTERRIMQLGSQEHAAS